MPDPLLLSGDCLALMRTFLAGAVSSVVCDPPYELGFMGKTWDRSGIAFDPATWREVLRVLAPGGYLLAFGGTRTYHRIASAIEDAGFEVRDCLSWQYGCLSDDSDALTRRGWVRGPELRDTDDVLQWDAATGVFAWARPSRIVVAPYTGAMVRLANRNTDQLLTPNHRVYARVQRHGRHAPATDYEVLDADAVGNRSSAWRVTLPVAAQLREGEPVDADYAYLVGWWLTDAWAHADGRACMFSQSKPETLARLREALAPYGASEYVKPPRKPAHAEEHTFYLTGPMAARLLSEHPARRLTWAVLGWGWDARHALYRGLMDGDGSQPSRQHAHTFWSKDAERRDVFLALATSLGYRAFIGAKDCVYVNTDTDTTEVQGKHRVAPVDYDGRVWCVSVPTGAFLARRNGRPFITGNSGFPKSLDVSKGIDKAAGAEREIVGVHLRHGGGSAVSCSMSGPLGTASTLPLTAPATDDAKRWAGWGTALKPAWEPIIVARKPLEGTTAANVLKYGTGALNIDGCRVRCAPGDEPLKWEHGRGRGFHGAEDKGPCAAGTSTGRWPANLILSCPPDCDGDAHAPGCPCAVLDAQSGTRTSGTKSPHHARNVPRLGNGGVYGSDKGTQTPREWKGDTGGASRFFNNLPIDADDLVPFLYVAKASRSEREAGLHAENMLCSCEATRAEWDAEDREAVTRAETVTQPQRATIESTTEDASEWPMSLHGSESTDPFRPGSTCITSMGTSPTIAPKTSSPSPNLTTSASIRGANSATVGGGSLVECAENESLSTRMASTYPETAARSTVDAAPAISESSSKPSKHAARVCSRCGKKDSREGGVWCSHPTVKPIAVMRWLVRLVTPPGGVVLDPFMGSGTTGIAAVREGFAFVGIEQDAGYIDIARARIAHARKALAS